MSVTAQQKDINDPLIINEFAQTIGTVIRLEYLYLLTVADIRGTNPTLWNSWKDSLLIALYSETRQALLRGLENPKEISEQISHTQNTVLAAISEFDPDKIKNLWGELDNDYFLRYTADEITWHTRALLKTPDQDLPLIMIRNESLRGGTEIFFYTKDEDNLFAIVTMTLDQMRLNILDARIITTQNNYALNTYFVLDSSGNTVNDVQHIQEITKMLKERIVSGDLKSMRVSRRIDRALKHFPIPTQVFFSDDIHHRYTIVELVSADRPGLLAQIGLAFVDCDVRLLNAKIATFGEKVEDVFFVTDKDNKPLQSEEQFDKLRHSIISHLDDEPEK